MSFAELSQLWLATFSLDPALCRDLVRCLRSLGNALIEDADEDSVSDGPQALVDGIVILAVGRLTMLLTVAPFLAFLGARGPAYTPGLGRSR
jgi:hypothetical protein